MTCNNASSHDHHVYLYIHLYFLIFFLHVQSQCMWKISCLFFECLYMYYNSQIQLARIHNSRNYMCMYVTLCIYSTSIHIQNVYLFHFEFVLLEYFCFKLIKFKTQNKWVWILQFYLQNVHVSLLYVHVHVMVHVLYICNTSFKFVTCIHVMVHVHVYM